MLKGREVDLKWLIVKRYFLEGEKKKKEFFQLDIKQNKSQYIWENFYFQVARKIWYCIIEPKLWDLSNWLNGLKV